MTDETLEKCNLQMEFEPGSSRVQRKCSANRGTGEP